MLAHISPRLDLHNKDICQGNIVTEMLQDLKMNDTKAPFVLDLYSRNKSTGKI